MESFSLHDLLRIIKTVTDTENTVRYSVQPRFKLEVMMIQLTKMEASVKIDELLSDIDDLKKKVPDNGIPVKIPTPLESSPRPSYKVPSSVEEAKPKYTFTQSAKTPSAEKQSETTGNASSLSTADIPFLTVQQQWGTIVDEMRKKKISVGTILGETTPLEIINGSLRIGCGDEFHRSTLVRNKEVLTETINSMLAAKLRIEPVLHSEARVSFKQKPAGNGDSVPSQKPDSTNDDHPLIKTLYKDFGVERIG